MTQREALRSELIVQTAVRYVDEFGIEALSLRKLGEELDRHSTAIYRHFRNRDELLSEMFRVVISDVALAAGSVQDEPRARIRAIAVAFRSALHKHPALVGTIVSTHGTEETYALQRQIAADMLLLGVSRDDVVAKYLALESFVFGSSMFDYLGAPAHLKHRLERFQRVRDGLFDQSAQDESQVDVLNERAFLLGLDAILDSFK